MPNYIVHSMVLMVCILNAYHIKLLKIETVV